MITQAFLDTVVPLARAHLTKLGLQLPDVPVVIGYDMKSPTNMGYTTFKPRCDTCDQFDRVPERVVIRPDNHADLGRRYAAEGSRSPFSIDCSEEIWASATITHELIHTALPWDVMDALVYNGHGPEFRALAVKAGLADDTAAFPGPALKKWFDEVVAPVLSKGEIK